MLHKNCNNSSFYTRELLSKMPTPRTNNNQTVYKKVDNIDVNQLKTVAGTGMPHRLIYELADYKHIPRVSLLTCQLGWQRGQTRTSINIDTLTILRSFFTNNKDNHMNKRYRIDGVNISNSFTSGDHHRHFENFPPKGVLIKVLRIDLLINDQARESIANKKQFDDVEPRVLEFLRSEVLRQFVVLDLSCGEPSRKVIEMASNKGLFNSSYHWLLIEDYTFNRQRDDDVVDDDLWNDSKLPQDIFTADATSSDTPGTSSGSKFGDNKINNSPEEDDKNKNVSSVRSSDNVKGNFLLIEKFLEKINININTELILAKRINGGPDSKEDYYMLYDVWNPGHQYGGSLNITKIGCFSKATGLQLQKWYRQTTTVIRRMDMKNSLIRCMIVVTNKNRIDDLKHYLTQQYDTHLDSMHRFNFALLSHVRDLYNFSLVVLRTPSWGYPKNGIFDGMIGALIRGEVDIGGSPAFFRIERAKVIDYTAGTWFARPCFLFRHPRTMKADQIIFLQPFTNDVWKLVAFCGIISIILMTVLTIVEQSFQKEVNKSVSPRDLLKKQKNKMNVKSKMKLGKNNPKDTRRKERKRQVDIEISSFTQNDALPVAKYGNPREIALQIANTVEGEGNRNVIAVRNEGFNTGVEIRKRGQVPTDYGGAILKRSKIDCIDYGVGVSGPINAVFPLHKESDAGDSKMRKTLKKSYIYWKKCFVKESDLILLKSRFQILTESFLLYIGSICQQGLALPSNLLSSRCVIITSLLFSFCIYQFYSASIVGTLLMEKPKTIRTLRDLVHSSLEVGIEDIPYNKDYFVRTKDPDAIELYEKKISKIKTPSNEASSPTSKSGNVKFNSNQTSTSKNHPNNIESSNWYDAVHGVEKIKQGGFAFHVDVAGAFKIISDTFTEREICELTQIQLFRAQRMVNIVKKGSPVRKIITYGLRRCSEAGLMDYQRKVWHWPKPRCVKQIHPDDLRVDMQTFTSAIFVLIFGFAASIVVLALEMVHNNSWQHFAT